MDSMPPEHTAVVRTLTPTTRLGSGSSNIRRRGDGFDPIQ
jgi:hypothetical protein